MKNAQQDEEGIWKGDIDTSRIFNCDKTPQFINYGVDETCNGLVCAGKGENCQRMYCKNREYIAVQPFVSFAGMDLQYCNKLNLALRFALNFMCVLL